MGDVYRESRYRDYDDPPSDDDRYRRSTVRRYKVKSGRDEPYENVEVDDDYRSRYTNTRSRDDYHDYERRSERPRSAFEPLDDRSRGGYYERDREIDRVERDYPSRKDSDRDRITVYEGKESDHDDRRSRYGRHDDDVRVERRVEDRFEDAYGHDVDHYRKETEYYTRASPPTSPVVVRERAREPQKIIVQEAPSTAPLVLPRQEHGAMVIRDKESGRELSRRDRGRDEDDYYYRRERREVGPYRGDIDRERERDREYAMARYDRYRRDQGYSSDEDDYHMRRRVVRRERSESPHHKRHLAAGALAGAGITALVNSRRDDHGDLPEHRGRKIAAGSALGALGTEAARRAHSAYEDRYRDGRESPDHHSHLKKGLGIAAVALAAAGAAKYYQSNKIEKEEAHRGRSRRRGRSQSGDEYSGSRSRSRTKSRRRSLSTAAKAALGTAATAGIVQHYRKKSQSRNGSRSRSKSRLRRAAEIGGAAAAAGVATKAWKSHKDKKERERSREASRSRDFDDDESDYRRRMSLDRGSRSRSRSRSQARSLRRQDTGADPQLGLVEYGHDPLSPDQSVSQRGYESEAEEHRRRRQRRRDRSASGDESDNGRRRSKSRLRDMAAAGAAAFGIKEYKDRKDQEKKEQRSRERRSRDRATERSRDRSRDHPRRRRDDEPEGYFDEPPPRPGSPPVSSGGAYYPPYPSTPGVGAGGPGGGYTQFPNQSAEFQPYIPQDYTGYPPPPAPGPPPATNYPAPPPGPPAPGPPPGPPNGGPNIPPDHVSNDTREHRRVDAEDGVKEPYAKSARDESPPPSKSVSFIPLSPMSSRTMEKHHKDHAEHVAAEHASARDGATSRGRQRHETIENPASLRRGVSDPSVDRRVTRNQTQVYGSDEDVEDLPDRFDSQGRPLNARSNSQGPHGQWTTRSGQFERRPQRSGDWDISGSWQVGGADPEAVERMVRGVTGVLDGRRGWMGVLGDVLNSGLLGGGTEERQGLHDDNTGRGRHRRR